MPEKITKVPMTLEAAVRYHIWDDASVMHMNICSRLPQKTFMPSSLRTTNARLRPFAP